MEPNALVRVVESRRTFFPEIVRSMQNEILLAGCFKAMEETGIRGVLVKSGGGGLSEISNCKVTITAVVSMGPELLL